MKARHLLFFLAASFALIARAEINTAYRITGDPAAAPVQAFDDGRDLFLQIRNSDAPPAPFSRDGRPLEYKSRFPYLVLPITEKVVLRYGARTALVEAATRQDGAAAGRSVWYGAAPPKEVTGTAPAPIAATAARRDLAIANTAAGASAGGPGSSPLSPDVGRHGRFKISTTEEDVVPNPMVVRAAEETTSDQIRQIKTIAGQVTIRADGSVAGYRKAQAVSKLFGPAVSKFKIIPYGSDKGTVSIRKDAP